MTVQESVMSNVETIEGNLLPHPEEKIFLDQLYVFMERRGSPISKVPNLGFKKSECFLPASWNTWRHIMLIFVI